GVRAGGGHERDHDAGQHSALQRAEHGPRDADLLQRHLAVRSGAGPRVGSVAHPDRDSLRADRRSAARHTTTHHPEALGLNLMDEHLEPNAALTDQPAEQHVTAPAIGAQAASPAPTTTPETVFEAENVSIYYSDFRAVTDVSFQIYQYEITAFIGPSGCGKTTVLRTLNRMNDLVDGARVEGDIKYHGASLYGPGVSAAAVRRRIGMVFQKPNPFPKSIYDNVAYGPRINGIRGKARLDEIVERSLRQAALWDEVKNRLGKSGLGRSGGRAGGLCIARTLAVDPDVVLMDEPCSALDPIATARIEDLMKQLRSEYTIVIVTHNMQQATRVSDRTAF